MSVQYAFFGLLQADNATNPCDEQHDVFLFEAVFKENKRQQVHCYQNLTQLLHDLCVGKYECIIDDILEVAQQDRNVTLWEYLADCPLFEWEDTDDHRNGTTVEVQFIAEMECNFPYSWDDQVYINDTMINRTIDIYQHIPWFMLPFGDNPQSNPKEDHDDSDDVVISVLNAIRGQTYSVDELRW